MMLMNHITHDRLAKHERDRVIAMAALADYRITEWRGSKGSACWEVSEPGGTCWDIPYATQYAAALAVCRKMGVQF